jgi:hypothetical protein
VRQNKNAVSQTQRFSPLFSRLETYQLIIPLVTNYYYFYINEDFQFSDGCHKKESYGVLKLENLIGYFESSFIKNEFHPFRIIVFCAISILILNGIVAARQNMPPFKNLSSPKRE